MRGSAIKWILCFLAAISQLPAALLAKSLLLAADQDDGGLGVDLADLVPAVVVPAAAEVGIAAVDEAGGGGLRGAAGPARALRGRGGGRGLGRLFPPLLRRRRSEIPQPSEFEIDRAVLAAAAAAADHGAHGRVRGLIEF